MLKQEKQYKIFRLNSVDLTKTLSGEKNGREWHLLFGAWEDRFGFSQEIPFFLGGYNKIGPIRLGNLYRVTIVPASEQYGEKVEIVCRVKNWEGEEMEWLTENEIPDNPFDDSHIPQQFWTLQEVAESVKKMRDTEEKREMIALSIIKSTCSLYEGQLQAGGIEDIEKTTEKLKKIYENLIESTEIKTEGSEIKK